MNRTSLEVLEGWNITGWSLPRNALFKLRLFDFRNPNTHPSDQRRGEAFFTDPSRIKFERIAVTPHQTIQISGIRETATSEGLVDYSFDLDKGGAIHVCCRTSTLVLLP